MNTAYVIASAVIFLFFGTIWRTDTALNAIIKTVMWLMLAWSAFLILVERNIITVNLK